MVLEERRLLRDAQAMTHAPFVLDSDAREYRVAHRGLCDQFRVARRHCQVGLGENHRQVREHAAKERPAPVHLR